MGCLKLDYHPRPWVEVQRKRSAGLIGREWSKFGARLSLVESPLREYDRGVEGFEDFCLEVLGVRLWEKQIEVAKSVIENERTAVISGHGVGKSFLAALLCVWWYAARGYPFLTTGPTKRHVEKVLWRYIGELYGKAKRKLPGKWFKSAKLEVKGQPWWWAEGFTSSENESGQGWHDDNVLVVGDEFAGLKKTAEAAIRSTMSSDGCRLLAIGNPNEERDTEFYRIFHDAEIGEEYHKIRISSWDTPNARGIPGFGKLASKEWCEGEKKRLWNTDRDSYRMKVLGLWPKMNTERKVIPYEWIVQSQKLWLALAEEEEDYPSPPPISRVFIDVSELGKDRTAMCYLAGQRIHVHRWWKPKGKAALMNIANYVAQWCRDLEDKPTSITIDADAVGAGVYSRLVEIQEANPDWFGDCQIVRFTWGGHAPKPDNLNFRGKIAWIHWKLRDAIDPSLDLQERIALPPMGPDGLQGAEIAKQLNLRRWKHNEVNAKCVESKASLRKRGAASPDVADAIVGCMDRTGELVCEPFFA